MTQFDRRFLTFVLAPISPILLFLAGWWISLTIVNDNLVFLFAFLGLFFGITLDVIYITHWVRNAFRMSTTLWLLIYGLYSIGFFGFFMGVPVFNLLLGIPAGVFITRQAQVLQFDRKKTKKRIELASRTTALYMSLICFFSAAIALIDPYTADNLEGMFHLSFDVTPELINLLIIVGGAGLIALQHVITRLSAKLTLNACSH